MNNDERIKLGYELTKSITKIYNNEIKNGDFEKAKNSLNLFVQKEEFKKTQETFK